MALVWPTAVSETDGYVPGTHLHAFFAQYPSFSYDPAKPSTTAFRQLCKSLGWTNNKNKNRIRAQLLFHEALVMEFNDTYGRDDASLQTWRGLCSALDISPAPESARQAKKIFRYTFVNLVDLVDQQRTGMRAQKFQNLNSLREYTRATGKFFPRENAYAGGILRFLLREITGRYEGHIRTATKAKGIAKRQLPVQKTSANGNVKP